MAAAPGYPNASQGYHRGKLCINSNCYLLHFVNIVPSEPTQELSGLVKENGATTNITLNARKTTHTLRLHSFWHSFYLKLPSVFVYMYNIGPKKHQHLPGDNYEHKQESQACPKLPRRTQKSATIMLASDLSVNRYFVRRLCTARATFLSILAYFYNDGPRKHQHPLSDNKAHKQKSQAWPKVPCKSHERDTICLEVNYSVP